MRNHFTHEVITNNDETSSLLSLYNISRFPELFRQNFLKNSQIVYSLLLSQTI